MPKLFPTLAALAFCGMIACHAPAHAQSGTPTGSPTLDAVRGRGLLQCGVSGEAPGFSVLDSHGVMHGLDADSCRAVAAAVLGDASRVRFVPLTSASRFTALQSGEVDVLIRTATWTLERDSNLGLEHAWVNYYDGTGFMVRKSLNVAAAKDLNGASVCVLPGSSTELALSDFFASNHIAFTPVQIEGVNDIHAAFLAGRCDAFSTDASSLATFRATLGDKAGDYALLPDIISKEPLAAMVRKGDDRWLDAVRWTLVSLLIAEEQGVNSRDVDDMLKSPKPDVKRLLGVEGNMGKSLGLDDRFAYNAVKQVGAFDEIWDRNLGSLGVPRGINALWNKGGLQYPPPMR